MSMDTEHHSAALDRLLDDVFGDRDTRSSEEILREARSRGVPQALLARLQLVPRGEYGREGLLRALPPDEDLWRSDLSLPLADLDRALATYSADGQVDAEAGGDAGTEEQLAGRPWPGPADTGGDPDPTSVEGRRLRPSPDGRPGPA
jgi:hypothetical protein